jgi:hypothetical protein
MFFANLRPNEPVPPVIKIFKLSNLLAVMVIDICSLVKLRPVSYITQ